MNRTSSRTHRPSPFQGVLQFPTVTGNVSFAAEHPLERIAYRALIVGIGMCAVVYVYCVVASVLNITALKYAVRESAVSQSAIGVLEEQHFVMSRNLTVDTSAQLGLARVESSSFVYRPGTVGIVSTAHDQI